MRELENLRLSIDKLDRKLLEILAERLKVVKKIKAVKKNEKIPILDPEREQKLHRKIAKTSLVLGLDTEFAKNFLI